MQADFPLVAWCTIENRWEKRQGGENDMIMLKEALFSLFLDKIIQNLLYCFIQFLLCRTLASFKLAMARFVASLPKRRTSFSTCEIACSTESPLQTLIWMWVTLSVYCEIWTVSRRYSHSLISRNCMVDHGALRPVCRIIFGEHHFGMNKNINLPQIEESGPPLEFACMIAQNFTMDEINIAVYSSFDMWALEKIYFQFTYI